MESVSLGAAVRAALLASLSIKPLVETRLTKVLTAAHSEVRLAENLGADLTDESTGYFVNKVVIVSTVGCSRRILCHISLDGLYFCREATPASVVWSFIVNVAVNIVNLLIFSERGADACVAVNTNPSLALSLALPVPLPHSVKSSHLIQSSSNYPLVDLVPQSPLPLTAASSLPCPPQQLQPRQL